MTPRRAGRIFSQGPAWVLTLAVIVGAGAACGPEKEEGRTVGGSRIEFLTRPECRNSTRVLAELSAALDQLAWDTAPVIVDLGELDRGDHRTGYGTPTILVDGRDLYGLPRPGPAAPA